jgi:glycosyltransferase involved in cell wall biosynthesis
MKLLLVHNRYQQPGGEDVVFEQERASLERAGHHVSIYERSNSEIDALTLVHRLGLVKNAVWSTSTRREFSQLLARELPDLVHVHNTFVMISPSIYGACVEHGIPVVQTLHNFRWMCPGAFFYRDGKVCEDCIEGGLWQGVRHNCYRGSRAATAAMALILAWHQHFKTWHRSIDQYIALTSFARDKFVSTGFPFEKIAVKPNFVGTDPGARTGAGDYAVFVGRLSAEKGIATLVQAWEQLPARCPLQIVGDGPERRELELQIRQRNIPGITFRGCLSRDETITTMKGARFAIVPSIWYENFPMVMAEAFACGTPVLCSRLGAMAEIVADRLTGLHFVAGNARDLAEKAAWAWTHPCETSELGRAARREYEKRYTAEKNYENLMAIYESTLARARGSELAAAGWN